MNMLEIFSELYS